jgi:hypothetical protein
LHGPSAVAVRTVVEIFWRTPQRSQLATRIAASGAERLGLQNVLVRTVQAKMDEDR